MSVYKIASFIKKEKSRQRETVIPGEYCILGFSYLEFKKMTDNVILMD